MSLEYTSSRLRKFNVRLFWRLLFSDSFLPRASRVDFWQTRLPQWWPHHQCATTADKFYSRKSRQDIRLASLTSCGGPAAGWRTFNDYMDKKRWSKKSLFLSTFRLKNVYVEVGGGQKGQNCVHVVIEWPSTIFKQILTKYSTILCIILLSRSTI